MHKSFMLVITIMVGLHWKSKLKNTSHNSVNLKDVL